MAKTNFSQIFVHKILNIRHYIWGGKQLETRVHETKEEQMIFNLQLSSLGRTSPICLLAAGGRKLEAVFLSSVLCFLSSVLCGWLKVAQNRHTWAFLWVRLGAIRRPFGAIWCRLGAVFIPNIRGNSHRNEVFHFFCNRMSHAHCRGRV